MKERKNGEEKEELKVEERERFTLLYLMEVIKRKTQQAGKERGGRETVDKRKAGVAEEKRKSKCHEKGRERGMRGRQTLEEDEGSDGGGGGKGGMG